MTSTTISGLGMSQRIVYGTIETLNIDLGSGGDIFNVRSTNPGTTTTVNTGDGTAANIIKVVDGIGAQSGNLITNGDFEGSFVADETGDIVPAGWTKVETRASEVSTLGLAASNGPSAAGAQSVRWSRSGGLSGDWTAVEQNLSIDASKFESLTLSLDTMVSSHNLAGGGCCGFEWPTIAQIVYTRASDGQDQVWRHGWYLSPPGDGDINDQGSGIIPIFHDTQVQADVWTSNSFDLFAELPDLGVITRFLIGGSGWSFEGRADNVSIGGNLGRNVDGIDGLLVVNGQSSSDTMKVDDTGDKNKNSGHLTSSSLTGLGMGSDDQTVVESSLGIRYSGLESLEISLGSGSDEITIENTHDGHSALNAGAGGDAVNVGGSALGADAHVNGIAGRLVVDGQSGTDMLHIDDQDDDGPETAFLTSSRVFGLDMPNSDALSGGISYNNFEFLDLRLGTRQDTINVQSTSSDTTTTVDTGIGAVANIINVGSVAPDTGGDVNEIAGKLIVNGQSDSDTLKIDDQDDDGPETAFLTSSRVFGLGMPNSDALSGGITYNNVEFLDLRLGARQDTVNVLGTNSQTKLTTVETGLGQTANTVNVGSAAPGSDGDVSGIAGQLVVTGQSDSDTLNVDDKDSGPETAFLTSSRIYGLDMPDSEAANGGITYSDVEFLNLRLGTRQDTVNVQSTSVDTVTTIDTGGGTAQNTVNVGTQGPGADGSVNGIAGRLIVNGQAAYDTVNISDEDDDGPETAFLTSTRVYGLDMPDSDAVNEGITYTDVEFLNLRLGTRQDTVNVQSTCSGTTTAIETGSGIAANTVNVGSTAPGTDSDVNGVAGRLVINGQSDSDTLNIDDKDPGPETAFLTSTRIHGLDMPDSDALTGGITFNDVEFLNLRLGTRQDTVNVQSTSSDTTTTIETGGGTAENAINVGSAGAASDNLIINGDFEGSLATDGDPGWTIVEPFQPCFYSEIGLDDALNGPSAPGSQSLSWLGFAPPWAPPEECDLVFEDRSLVEQNLSIDASQFGGLTLSLDTMVTSQFMTSCCGEYWPVFVQIDYTRASNGQNQVWKHGWYVSPPGTSSHSGSGIIPAFHDTLVESGTWTVNSFDLFAELPDLGVVTRIRIGGMGVDFAGRADNVAIVGTQLVGNANGIEGLLVVGGQSTADTMNVDDTGDTERNEGHLSANAITGLGMGNADQTVVDHTLGVRYSGLESLEISLGSGSDTFTVENTHQCETTLNTGPNDDTIHISDASGIVVVNGQDNNDTANVNGTGAASLVTVHGQSGDDTFNVRAIAGQLRVRGDQDSDTVNVGDQAPALPQTLSTAPIGSLHAIDGLLDVDGGSGSDVMNVDDSRATDPTSGALTKQTLRGLGMEQGINHMALEELNIWLSSHGDEFTIDGSPGGMGAVPPIAGILGGAGDDVFSLLGVGEVTARIEGQSGVDNLSYGETVSVTLTSSNASGYAGHNSGAYTAEFTGIDILDARGDGDALVGEDTSSTWTLTDGDGYSYDNGQGNGVLTLRGFETLQGGSEIDTFAISADDTAADQPIAAILGGEGDEVFDLLDGGKVDAIIDGQNGIDTLKYRQSVAVTLTGSSVSGYAGHDGGAFTGGFAGIDVLNAPASGDSLGGENADSMWTLTDVAGYTYSDDLNHGVLTFTGFETLLGGTKVDTFLYVGGPYTIAEGDDLVLGGSDIEVIDTGDDPPYSWDLNGDEACGDATGRTPTVSWAALQKLDPAVNDDGSYTIGLCVSGDSPVPDAATNLTVTNTPPRANTGGPYTIAEGDDLVLAGWGIDASDADNAILDYGWDLTGDGTFEDALGAAPTISWATLQVLRPAVSNHGSFSITLRVSDDGNVPITDSTTVIAKNVAPNFEAGPNEQLLPAVAGALSRNGITFTDPGPDVWTGTVNFGDGTGDQPLTIDQVAKSFDLGHRFEGEGVFTVSVTLSDGDPGGTYTDTFMVNVGLNQPPDPPQDVNPDTDAVAEGAVVGTTVGVTAEANDPDGNPLVYSLTDDAGGRFAIDSDTGVVTVANGTLLDFETRTSHKITVKAEDPSGETSSADFTINILNENPTAPIDANAAANDVEEGAANGTTVGITAVATDPNGPDVTFSLTDNTEGRFAIDSITGVVTVADGTLLNFETADKHRITVQASDGAGGTSTASLTINVSNADPTAPVDADLVANKVEEGAANGTRVGITAVATDRNGSAVTFSLTDNADGRFTIDSITGVVTVADGTLLDFETADSHTITVQTSDGAGGTSTANLTIKVSNADPTAPVDTDVAANKVEEGATYGTTLGITAVATDPNGPAVTFSLTDNADGRFTIDSVTGVVTVADGTLLDFETADKHTITVQASDGAGGTSTANLTVRVLNTDPTAPVDGDAAANKIDEGATNGTTVGITAAATDPNGPVVKFSLTDNADGRFAIDSSSGVVTVADGSRLDGIWTHTITVLASDTATGTSHSDFTVAVRNVAPRVTTPGLQTAEAGVDAYFRIGSYADPGDDGPWLVTVDWGDDSSDTVFLAHSVGRLPNQSHTCVAGGLYTVAVTVTEEGGAGASGTDTFQISVDGGAPVNEPPVITTTAFLVPENNTMAGTVLASDPDGPAQIFSLPGGSPDDSLFTISPSGVLSFLAAPDFEDPRDADGDNAYQVLVQVDDGGAGGVATKLITVKVTDVQETAPPLKIVSVKVGSSTWAPDFNAFVDPTDKLGYEIPAGAGQLDPLPWVNIDTIHVKFSQKVSTVTQADVELRGVNVPDYAIQSITFDASTLTATIKLDSANSPIGADKLRLVVRETVIGAIGGRLDGEWTDGGATESGDGTAGGDFLYRFNVLAADVFQDGAVFANGAAMVLSRQLTFPFNADYSIFSDVDGSASIFANDASQVLARQLTWLPLDDPVSLSMRVARALPVANADAGSVAEFDRVGDHPMLSPAVGWPSGRSGPFNRSPTRERWETADGTGSTAVNLALCESLLPNDPIA
jgi:hypothetical protein